MAARLVAIGILAVILVIAGAFMAIAILGPREQPPVAGVNAGAPSELSSAEGQVFTGKLGPWRLDGQLALAPTGAYRLTLRVSDDLGRPAPASFAPTVRLDMLDHAMSGGLLRVESADPGLYQAAGKFDMEGRWRFRIAGAGDAFEFTAAFRR